MLYEPSKRDIIEFSRTIQRDPTKPSTYANRGVLYSLLGMHDEAIRDFSQAIELDRHNGAFLVRRGILYGKQGPLRCRHRRFQPGHRTESRLCRRLHPAGHSVCQEDKPRRAVESLDRAIDLKAVDVNPAGGMYLIHAALSEAYGTRQQTLNDLRKYISLIPLNPDGYYRLAQACFDTEEVTGVMNSVPPPEN